MENSGTIKGGDQPLANSTMADDPHPGCPLYILGWDMPTSTGEGLPHQRCHDLRHACASLLLAQGMEPKLIREVLGYTTITITADLYAHGM